jgi:hypothetical protein
MSKKFEIFISYRRKGGYDTAKLLYDRLRMDGYSVSFDIDTLEKGDFDDELKKRVQDCKDFLLVLNPGVFDRFFDPDCDPKDDWVRQEIVCALEKGKEINIVPLILDGFLYPKNLPEDVKNITKKNAINLEQKHFESEYARMKQKFLVSKPHWAKRYKKWIISLLSIVLFGVAAIIFFQLRDISAQSQQKDRALEEERKARQLEDSIKKAELDSIKRAMQQSADSIRKAALDSMKNTQAAAQKAAPQKPAGSGSIIEKPPQKSSGRSVHWSGAKDAIGHAIYDKLASTGIKETKCTDNGLAVKLNKPNCKADNLAKIICSYSPKITITDCNNKMITVLETTENFKSSTKEGENAAKDELANMLRGVNFSDWVSAIKKL